MRQKREVTQKKYSAFIQECYNSKTFDAISLSKKHKVDASLITTLSKLEMVVLLYRGVYNWIGPHPTDSDVAGFIDLHRDRMREYKKQRDERMEQQKVAAPDNNITEQQAVEFLKSLGCYEIYKVERKQL